MENQDLEKRLTNVEMVVAVQDRTIDDLNQVVFEQGKKIDFLIKQNKLLIESLNSQSIKNQDDETPPPHY